jgi:putative two-component system response regulator
LVDDEGEAREVLAILFERSGYQVITAVDAQEALVRLHERRPDLVITDYWMPKMDGVALCRRMHEDERWRDIPVIIMSAVLADDIPWPPGVVAVADKPIQFPALLRRVRQILGQEE